MRWWVVGVCGVACAVPMTIVRAEDKPRTGERVVNGVISGLLGTSQPAPDAAYAAQERERLVNVLQHGEYATSRQSEPIDLMILGVPLTRTEHVYSAKPIPPSAVSDSQTPR